jgi:hypothetical protein
MAKAYEISVWKPHKGKTGAFIKSMSEVAAIFKENGVSEIVMMSGHAGKDVGNIVVLQTFKSLTDNGIVNDAIGDSAAMKAWIEKNKDNDFADMVSHDLYAEES